MLWKLKTNDFKESTVTVDFIACEKKNTILLSLKKLALFWTLAALSVFVPLLHFILVPVFLGLGIFAFIAQYKNKFYVRTDDFQCPQCLQNFNLKNFYFFDGKKMICTHCMTQIKFEQN